MKNILSIILLSALLMGCKKDGPEPEPEQAVVQYQIEVIGGTISNPQSTITVSYKTNSGETKSETFAGLNANKIYITEFFDTGLRKTASFKMETSASLTGAGYNFSGKIIKIIPPSDKEYQLASKIENKGFELSAVID